MQLAENHQQQLLHPGSLQQVLPVSTHRSSLRQAGRCCLVVVPQREAAHLLVVSVSSGSCTQYLLMALMCWG